MSDVIAMSRLASSCADVKRDYCARIFHYNQNKGEYASYNMIDFVVTRNVLPILTAVKEEYERLNALLVWERVIEFERDAIIIDMPIEGVAKEDGWRMQPLSRPVIEKETVDRYEEGTTIPKCQFSAIFEHHDRDFIPPLQHRTNLVGARYPNDVITFNLPPRIVSVTAYRKRILSESDAAPPIKRLKSELRSTPMDIPGKLEAECGSPFTEDSIIKPTMNNLYPNSRNIFLLKWKNAEGKTEKLRIVSEISHKWKAIGSLVDIPWSQLEHWSMGYQSRDSEECCAAVLNYWLDNPTDDYPATWDGLCELLEDCELAKVADKFREATQNFQTKPLPESDVAPYAVKSEVADKLEDELSEAKQGFLKEPLPELDTYYKSVAELRGVDVCGETTIVINKSSQEFVWQNYGFKLTIPENSLPEEVEQCAINIKASITGQYQFPDDGHLVSAVFWLSCDPPCRFQKPITVEMDHCAKPGNAAKLGFVRAKCTQGSLPYTFERIAGGQFTNESQYGSVQLNGFSGAAVELRNDTGTPTEPPPLVYGARVYSMVHQHLTSYKIDFVVTKNLETHLTAVSNEYMRLNARLEWEKHLEFENDKVELDVPSDGVKIHKKKWKLVPLSVPEIMRHHVDCFEQGTVIPYCRFSANNSTASGGENVPVPLHKVNLTGTKTPDFVHFIITHDQLPCQLPAGGAALPVDKLEMVIDGANDDVATDLGRIADNMTEWEGKIAESLRLRNADIAAIKKKHPDVLRLQIREALLMWRQREGSRATYNNLIKVFENAGYYQYAEFTKRIILCKTQ